MCVRDIPFLNAILEVDPENLDALIELGWLQFDDAHDAALAISTLEGVLRVAPENARAAFWLAKVHYHFTSYLKKAREYLELALANEPGDPASASLYGAVCCELDDPQPALAPLQAAFQREPSWVSLAWELGSVHAGMAQPEKGIVYAEQAIRMATRFHAVSTPENYSYYESCITQRWVDEDSLSLLQDLAARRV